MLPDDLDRRWSRILMVPDSTGTRRQWHILDNLSSLQSDAPVGTLLCVHGNPTWSYLWRHVIERVSTAERPWRVIAVDQLNMGWSERTGTRRRLAQRVEDLTDLTQALDLHGPVGTLGHDWGGVISLGWALSHQDQVAGVALLNTAVHQPPGSAIPALIALARLPGVRWAVTAASPFFLQSTLALAHPRLPAATRAAYLTRTARGRGEPASMSSSRTSPLRPGIRAGRRCRTLLRACRTCRRCRHCCCGARAIRCSATCICATCAGACPRRSFIALKALGTCSPRTPTSPGRS